MADARRAMVTTSPLRLWAGVALMLAGVVVVIVGSWPTVGDISPGSSVFATALNIAGLLTIISSRAKMPQDVPAEPQH